MPYPNSRIYAGTDPLDAQPGVMTLLERREPVVQAIYVALMAASNALGPVTVSASKSSVHLMAKSAFAAVCTRKLALLVSIKSAFPVESRRVRKTLQASAHRYYFDVLLESVDDIDDEFREWLEEAYELSR